MFGLSPILACLFDAITAVSVCSDVQSLRTLLLSERYIIGFCKSAQLFILFIFQTKTLDVCVYKLNTVRTGRVFYCTVYMYSIYQRYTLYAFEKKNIL